MDLPEVKPPSLNDLLGKWLEERGFEYHGPSSRDYWQRGNWFNLKIAMGQLNNQAMVQAWRTILPFRIPTKIGWYKWRFYVNAGTPFPYNIVFFNPAQPDFLERLEEWIS